MDTLETHWKAQADALIPNPGFVEGDLFYFPNHHLGMILCPGILRIIQVI